MSKSRLLQLPAVAAVVFLTIYGGACGNSPESGLNQNPPPAGLAAAPITNDHEFEELKKRLADQPERLARVLGPNLSSDVERLPNGNYEGFVTGPDGRKVRRVFLGDGWMRQTVLQSLRYVPGKENQLVIYQTLNNLWQRRANPEQVAQFPDPQEAEKWSAAELTTLNNSLTNALRALGPPPAENSPALETLTAPPACSAEEGVGRSTDGSQVCTRGASSLFNKITFPLKGYLNCVKDQGRRGTCVAFSSIGAVEAAVAVQKDRWVNLSEQDYYRYGRWLTDSSDSYSDGLDSYLTLWYTSTNYPTFAFEKDWDYNPANSRIDHGSYYENSCSGYPGFPCSDSNHEAFCSAGSGRFCFAAYWDLVAKTSDIHLQSIGLAFPDDAGMAEVKVLLDAKFPFVLDLNVTRDFDSAWSNGIISLTAGGTAIRGGHAVEIVGYIDNSSLPGGTAGGSGGGYFIAKNSWGCWGDGGYVYIPYDYVKANGHRFNGILGLK